MINANKITRRSISIAIFTNNFDIDFLKFIDYSNNEVAVNKNAVRLEFPTRLYIQFYNEKVLPIEGTTQLKNIFALDSMINSKVFTLNKNEGTLTMCQQLYQYLTWLDSDRATQYSIYEFESYRSDIVRIVDDICTNPYNSEVFSDAVIYLNNRTTEIINLIQSNIEVLINKVEEIAYLYQNKENGLSDMSLDDLYNKANKLYMKNVQPCLEFVSPTFQLKGKETFTKAMERLINHFSQNDHITEALSYRYKLGMVTSYYKDIDRTAKRLQSYITNISIDREGYLAIENAFNDLVSSLDHYRHGKTTNIYFSSDHQFFENNLFFKGLSSFKNSNKFGKKINLSPDLIDKQLQVYYQDLMEKPIIKRNIRDELLVLNRHNKKIIERQQYLFDLLCITPLPNDEVNLYQYLYDLFLEMIPDFDLIDLLYITDKFKVLHKNHFLKYKREKFRIEDENYYLETTLILFKSNSDQI